MALILEITFDWIGSKMASCMFTILSGTGHTLHDWIFILNIKIPRTDFCNNTTYLQQLQKIRHVEKLFITYPVCLEIHNSFRRTIFSDRQQLI